MQVGFQGRFLSQPFTGIGQYSIGLLQEFQKQKEIEIIVATLEKAGRLKKHYFEQYSAPKLFLKQKVDLIHFPYPSHPWKPLKIPTVVTVHDVIPWIFPEYKQGILSALAHEKAKHALHFAKHIITVSEFSKKEIQRVCAVPGDKISVIYNGCSEIYSKKADTKILGRFHLQPKQYFLYAGGYDQRKNVTTLIEAFKKFASNQKNATLVLAGNPLYQTKLYTGLTFKNEGDTIDPGDKIVCTGFVDQETLAALYQNAAAFVHLSKYEGFNIPLLEAAKSGSPLILSDIPVHREIAITNAVFVDSMQVSHIITAMQKIWNNPSLQSELSEKSHKLAQAYSWQKSAQEHLFLYKKLCQQPPFSPLLP